MKEREMRRGAWLCKTRAQWEAYKHRTSCGSSLHRNIFPQRKQTATLPTILSPTPLPLHFSSSSFLKC